MENKLRKLFEFQKFSKNQDLEEAIKQGQIEGAAVLDDDQLLAAAGGMDRRIKEEEGEEND